MTLQDHIHIGLDSDWPTNHNTTLYHAAMPAYDDRRQVAVVADRGLTGKLLIHASTDSNGLPRQFRDFSITLLATQAEKTRLEALNGLRCYFIPNDHADGTAHAKTGGWRVLMTIQGSKMVSPDGAYWLMALKCQEDTL